MLKYYWEYIKYIFVGNKIYYEYFDVLDALCIDILIVQKIRNKSVLFEFNNIKICVCPKNNGGYFLTCVDKNKSLFWTITSWKKILFCLENDKQLMENVLKLKKYCKEFLNSHDIRGL